MTDVHIISKEPMPIAHLAKILKAKKKEERADIQNKILDYSKKASKLTEAECNKLMAEIEELKIPGMTKEQIVAIADLVPPTMTELRAVLSGKANISSENFKRILEVVGKYAK